MHVAHIVETHFVCPDPLLCSIIRLEDVTSSECSRVVAFNYIATMFWRLWPLYECSWTGLIICSRFASSAYVLLVFTDLVVYAYGLSWVQFLIDYCTRFRRLTNCMVLSFFTCILAHYTSGSQRGLELPQTSGLHLLRADQSRKICTARHACSNSPQIIIIIIIIDY